MNGISTMASMLRQQGYNTALQGHIDGLTSQISSGTYADMPLQLGASTSLLYKLQSENASQTAVQTAATAVGSKLSTMQTTLTSIASLVSDMSSKAVGAAGTAGDQGVVQSTMGVEGAGAMDRLLGMLNTTYGGQYLFSGQDSGTPAVQSSSANAGGPTAALSTLVSNAVAANGGAPLTGSSVSGLESSIDAMFGDASGSSGTNYTGAFFTASDNGQPVTVSVGGDQTVSYDMKANSPAFRSIFKGLSMLSMLGSSSGQMDESAKTRLLNDAVTALGVGQASLTNDTAALGVKQTQLAGIAASQQSAAAATQTQINNLTSVDVTTASTQLLALKNQLSASYELTAQIPKLSFVNYMG